MKRIIVLIAILSLVLAARGQGVTSTQDYILTTTFTTASSTGGSPIYDVEYYDNLGYPIQRISVAASPSGKSIVTPIYYDAVRRETQQYLPYVASVTTGAYVAPATAVSNQKSFYNSKYSGNNGYSYTEDVYEASPLDRVTTKWNVGNVYRTNSKKTTFVYSTNNSVEVDKYTATRTSTIPTRSGRHATGALLSVRETNEDGYATLTFTDVEGRVVLDRIVDNTSMSYVDTHYIYDEVGNLRFVLPPELSAKSSFTSADMDNYAYVYTYNADRNTLSSKKLPGAIKETYTYDKGDRMISRSQGSNTWNYVYDNLGRLTQEKLGSVITAEYQYGTTPASPLNFSAEYVVSSADNDTSHRQNMKTYEKVMVMDGTSTTSTYVERAFYYDYKGRLLQTVEKNHLGGISRYSTKYNFVGDVVHYAESHRTSATGTATGTVYAFNYDSRGRLLRAMITLDEGPLYASTIDYAYDDLGRLQSKIYGQGTSAVTETYAYNIQGWQTSQSSPLFESQLRYFDPRSGSSKARFAGDIAEWRWQHNGSGAPTSNAANSYEFTYDRLGRLTANDHKGASTITATSWGTPARTFTEAMTYDRNGNIATLTRKGYHATSGSTSLLTDNLAQW